VETLQVFVHQQSTGRRSAFLTLFGDLCKKLVDEYDGLSEKLDHIIELEVYIYNLLGFLADRVLLARLNI
jgi:hypothetical protein